MIRTTRTPLNLFRRGKLRSGPSQKSHATNPIELDASDPDPEESDAAESIPGKSVTGIKPQTTGSTGSSVTKRKEQGFIPSVPSGPLGSLADRAQMEVDRLARRKCMLQAEETAGDSKRQRISGTTTSSTPKTPLASRMFYDGAFFPTATLHANPRADGREVIRFEDITCPRLGKGGCVHMKYILIFYKIGHLRVVISTANLIPLDWSHLENHVFIQDISFNGSSGVIGSIPFAENAKLSSSKAKPEDVLKATNVGPALEKLKQRKSELPLNSIADLSKMWDWRNVRVELVTSLAGKWEGWKQVRATGHPRLMRAWLLNTNLVVECQGLSIGTYTTQWFNQFYLSASGHSSALKAHMDLSEGKRKKLEYPLGIKVGANSLFCTRKKWEVKNFPRAAFHDSKRQAGRVLMHTKMIIGSFTPKRDVKPESSNAAGWMYVGSHNLTSGNLSGSASAPVLNVNNFELGVVVPLETAGDVNKVSAWERPPRKYTAADLPWLKDENATHSGI
ncbi:tyrosyl-DNA phosphodiesterase-domain-containing protein [Mycena maculata]|uniref:Tyrosyl-DNA phosphodiesterase-domain-containing protein n=1 Tax=Mycena maculata TaxID=230809 RepID=A0AAD7K7S3_9AGAR|nr:tyrosyl-DNA phosphodiesterase-domain-containing protein [Mycena maculata]